MLIFADKMTVTHNNKTQFARGIAVAAAFFAANGVALTAHAQQSDGVLVDVDACLALETRTQQLACYEERVNEVLRARESEANAGTSEPETAPVADESSTTELSRSERRAQRRAERDAEKEQSELERRQRVAAEAAAAAEVAAAQAAAAAAAARDNSDYIAGEIVAEVVELREMEPDAWLITLDNGQIWRQNLPKRYPLFVGTKVELRPGNWGPSYRLTNPNVGNFIQVRRVN